jgi:hypothetical protein
MNAQSTPSPLDPTTLASLFNALSHPPGATDKEIADRQNSALAAVASLRPRDPLEAALAIRIVVAHHAVMESFRLAAQPDLPASLLLRHQGKAIAFSRLMDSTLRELTRRQAAPALRPAAALPAAPPALPKQAPQPATAKTPAQPAPVARAPAPQPAAGSAPALSPAERERMLRDIAGRAATAAPALAA